MVVAELSTSGYCNCDSPVTLNVLNYDIIDEVLSRLTSKHLNDDEMERPFPVRLPHGTISITRGRPLKISVGTGALSAIPLRMDLSYANFDPNTPPDYLLVNGDVQLLRSDRAARLCPKFNIFCQLMKGNFQNRLNRKILTTYCGIKYDFTSMRKLMSCMTSSALTRDVLYAPPFMGKTVLEAALNIHGIHTNSRSNYFAWDNGGMVFTSDIGLVNDGGRCIAVVPSLERCQYGLRRRISGGSTRNINAGITLARISNLSEMVTRFETDDFLLKATSVENFRSHRFW